ncbi:hypothetical protein K8W59_03810 [Nocardioides rotundus]|uniref:aggregation-promoting factor C-terminal-like domain-containing protein n=1 Tax=Nocardioides rotundus TaxID=1774216 RepID=UPI001CBDD68D|nr:hypothetical protein [Nocardioides rotundus]UAL30653.1 hypothetical protein K8W59_03810 [Nocardioides rotundus]
MRSPAPKAGKHRGPSARSASHPLRTSLATAALAATATGVAVAGGLVTGQEASLGHGSAAAAGVSTPVVEGAGSSSSGATAEELRAERAETVSRSDNRAPLDAAKLDELSTQEAPAASYEENLDDADPRTIARALLPEYGFSSDQFSCLDALYNSESGWNMYADNPTSSAYGIPQALTQTHDMPPGYFTSAEVQIRWGLNYIRGSYGSPCSAWSFKQANNWY